MRSHHEDDEIDSLYDGPSKSQRKRDAEGLKDLGVLLVELSPSELAGLPLNEALIDAIELAHRITSHGAAARHRQRIGKLLRHVDAEAIRAVIDARELSQKFETRDFHRVENWRDRLLAEGTPALEALAATLSGLDVGRLKALMETARVAAPGAAATKAGRELFRYLRQALAESAEAE